MSDQTADILARVQSAGSLATRDKLDAALERAEVAERQMETMREIIDRQIGYLARAVSAEARLKEAELAFDVLASEKRVRDGRLSALIEAGERLFSYHGSHTKSCIRHYELHDCDCGYVNAMIAWDQAKGD